MLDYSSNKSLILVLGAGASREAGLPTGSELKPKIASALDIRYRSGREMVSGDRLIAQALMILTENQGRPQDVNAYLHTARLISGAMPQAESIDNFINSHKKDNRVAECGKIAIAKCILDAEASSYMHIDHSNMYNKIDFSQLAPTWFNEFFRLIVENCGHEELPERMDRLAVISFNYDRCIEYYLQASLQNYYGISHEHATKIMSHLEIYHPYGVVGFLPWMNRTPSIEYGEAPSAKQLLELSLNLKTFTEGTDEKSSSILAIRNLIQTTKRVMFLGFAFHPLNLALLYGTLDEPHIRRDCPVYATAHGLSQNNSQIIITQLARGGHRQDQIFLRRDMKCAAYFREYLLSLYLS